MAPATEPARFIADNTRPGRHPLVPEITLRLADRITPIWHATETGLEAQGVEPPYWAFVWPGGAATARLLLDRPERVAGRRVLDVAAGSGIAAIAAARAGAAAVTASEIDALAAAAIAENARANGVDVEVVLDDLLAAPAPAGERLILAGDVCYERRMAERMAIWLGAAARAGAEVWLADPGRAYLPGAGLEEIARYAVPTTRELEDRETRETVIYRLAGT